MCAFYDLFNYATNSLFAEEFYLKASANNDSGRVE